MKSKGLEVKICTFIFLLLCIPAIAHAGPDVSISANPSQLWVSGGGSGSLFMDFTVNAASPEPFIRSDV